MKKKNEADHTNSQQKARKARIHTCIHLYWKRVYNKMLRDFYTSTFNFSHFFLSCVLRFPDSFTSPLFIRCFCTVHVTPFRRYAPASRDIKTNTRIWIQRSRPRFIAFICILIRVQSLFIVRDFTKGILAEYWKHATSHLHVFHSAPICSHSFRILLIIYPARKRLIIMSPGLREPGPRGSRIRRHGPGGKRARVELENCFLRNSINYVEVRWFRNKRSQHLEGRETTTTWFVDSPTQ